MVMDTEDEVIARLEAAGYEHHFKAHPDGLQCPECDEIVDPRTVRVEETARFEGASDPGDGSVVLAIADGPCGHRGFLVSAYGAEASPDEAEVLRLLSQGDEQAAADAPDDPVTAREAAEQALIETGESDAGAELGDQID